MTIHRDIREGGARCTCFHLRSSHDIEQPYGCFGWDVRPTVDAPCHCQGFEYPALATPNSGAETPMTAGGSE